MTYPPGKDDATTRRELRAATIDGLQHFITLMGESVSSDPNAEFYDEETLQDAIAIIKVRWPE